MACLRERWGSRTLFIFAAIGSAIGLGNVWRFPYLTYEYGGAAFLIPWVISIIVVGIPWLMMEFGIGRYFQRSAPGVFEAIGKKWEWLGWWPAFVAFLIVCYYAVILAWALRFAISSISMAWGTGQAGVENASNFFFNDILQISSGPGELGSIIWMTVLMLAIVWAAIFFIIYRGPKFSGKVAVWTVLIPWALLVILAIRGLTLPGALEGLNFYLSPDFSELSNAKVWFAAVSQVAFSLSVGMAGMFAYGSWIARKADVTNNAVISSFADSATAFFAGFAVFSTLGFLAQSLNQPLAEVAGAGLGLAFVTFPAAISMMPAANALFGILFFLALFFLGIDSAFFLAHGGVVGPLTDKFGWSCKKTTLVVCIVCFLVGILFCTQGGLYWLDIVDRSVSFYGLLITGLLATIVVGWFFGAGKLRAHLNETSDIRVGAWWDWMLKLIVPVGILLLVITGGFMEDLKAPYGGYPAWAANMIWVILGVTLVISIGLNLLKTKGPKEEE
jgi:neurotransmitter:Na+ symporter, NSS family